MSMTVVNAYRYPIEKQQFVHRTLMSNCEKVTRRLVDDAVHTIVPKLDADAPDTWIDKLTDLMSPSMPKEFLSRRCELYIKHSTPDPEMVTRAFLYDYRAWTTVRHGEWPLFDTLNTWSYLWDENGHGYLVLFLALGVEASEMTEGLHWVLDPFNCYGSTGETNNSTLSYDEVKAVWDSVLNGSAPSYAGASAGLEGFELSEAFGLN